MSQPLRVCKICGFIAYDSEDLKRFVSCTKSKYGHSNFCKKCFSTNETQKNKGLIPRHIKKPYLKKCGDCGIEAITEKDLKLFLGDKDRSYGRKSTCKNCHNRYNRDRRKVNPDSDTRRRMKLELIEEFPKPIKCYFCGKEITKINGLDSDSLFLHSLDLNHENWVPENKVPSHHKCHTKYHISGDKNPNRIASLKRKEKRERTSVDV